MLLRVHPNSHFLTVSHYLQDANSNGEHVTAEESEVPGLTSLK